MNELRAYRRERLPLRRFGPLALAIGHLGAAPGPESLPRTALALLMIASFRVRDDLADRERDAVAHPKRVLVRARSTRPFAVAVVAGTTLAFVGLSLLRGPARGLGLLALAAAFELGYRLELPGRHRWVPLKYPVFAGLLATRLAPTLAGLCYLALAIHERLDDEGLRSRPDANLRLAAYLLAAASLVVARSQGGLR
ncbi:MAG: hypothetical protein R6X02_05910 [Enhygromyxa sp.]